jgi:hypothetical protein
MLRFLQRVFRLWQGLDTLLTLGKLTLVCLNVLGVIF